MAKILMAWELGGGPGALARLAAVASVLASDGHQPIFVIRNLIQPAAYLRDHGYPAYQAPDWRSPLAGRVRESQIAGYADMLASSGFSDAIRISAILRAWDALIDYLRPDAAIADSSPALMLAARARFPVIAIGDGFMLPPSQTDEFPVLLPKVRAVLPQPSLLEAINRVLRERGGSALAKLPDMVEAQADFVLSLAALDPYAEMRARPAIGPIEALAPAAPPPAGRGIFAALDASFPGVPTVMAGFARAELPATVFLRGATPEARRKYQDRNIRMVENPPDNALTDAAVVVHHGGATGTTHALASGRAQCIVPTGLESHLTGQILRKLGVGEMIPIRQSAEHIGSALTALVADRGIAERATAVAAGLERPEPGEVLARVLDGCRALLNSA